MNLRCYVFDLAIFGSKVREVSVDFFRVFGELYVDIGSVICFREKAFICLTFFCVDVSLSRLFRVE